MIMLTCIQVLFNATTTTKYAILDLIVLNADTDVSTKRLVPLQSVTRCKQGTGHRHKKRDKRMLIGILLRS